MHNKNETIETCPDIEKDLDSEIVDEEHTYRRHQRKSINKFDNASMLMKKAYLQDMGGVTSRAT